QAGNGGNELTLAHHPEERREKGVRLGGRRPGIVLAAQGRGNESPDQRLERSDVDVPRAKKRGTVPGHGGGPLVQAEVAEGGAGPRALRRAISEASACPDRVSDSKTASSVPSGCPASSLAVGASATMRPSSRMMTRRHSRSITSRMCEQNRMVL